MDFGKTRANKCICDECISKPRYRPWKLLDEIDHMIFFERPMYCLVICLEDLYVKRNSLQNVECSLETYISYFEFMSQYKILPHSNEIFYDSR